MHLKNAQNKLSNAPIIPKLWDTIDSIQKNLNLSDEQMSRMINLLPGQYQKQRTSGSDLPAIALFSLAEELELNFEDLIYQNFDYNLLKKKLLPGIELHTRAISAVCFFTHFYFDQYFKTGRSLWEGQ